MRFLSKLFSGKKKNIAPPADENEWDQVVYCRDTVDFHNQQQRTRYITNCLEQMEEASNETEKLRNEYQLVTSYLTDMEEIDALPEMQHKELEAVASQLVGLEAEIARYRGKANHMSDGQFYAMRKLENDVEEGIRKIAENEKYANLIRKDLRRLDGERHAYTFRQEELEQQMNNDRGMSVIFGTALVACLVLLAILQFGFGMEVMIGYFLSISVAAIALTAVCVRYMDADKDKARVSNDLNKIIQLQNTVKIRYVNNRQLLDYYYMKYDVKNGEELANRYRVYLQEKEARRQFTEAQAKTEYYQKQLTMLLTTYRVHDPGRWIGQVSAILDKREMVELRHSYILRRQALREQMEYNTKLAETAKEEIKSVARQYPAYAKEILDMTNRFDVS